MKKALRIILLLLFIGIFAYSGWNLATYYLAAHQQEQTVSGLRKQLVEEDDSYDRNADGILKRYEKLYTENPDMIGCSASRTPPSTTQSCSGKGTGSTTSTGTSTKKTLPPAACFWRSTAMQISPPPISSSTGTT